MVTSLKCRKDMGSNVLESFEHIEIVLIETKYIILNISFILKMLGAQQSLPKVISLTFENRSIIETLDQVHWIQGP